MTLLSAAAPALPSVETTLNYLVPGSERPFRYTYDPEPGTAPDNQVYMTGPAVEVFSGQWHSQGA